MNKLRLRVRKRERIKEIEKELDVLLVGHLNKFSNSNKL
jgi:hypothetical protein